MSATTECPTCVKAGSLKPFQGRYRDSDGLLRCVRHSDSPEASAIRSESAVLGKAEAKERKAKGIAGPKRGRGLAAADAPPRPPRAPLDPSMVPVIDFTTADAVTRTMERIIAALFASEGVTPDTVRAAQSYCETAQKIRAPRGGQAKDAKPVHRVIHFETVEPTRHPGDDAYGDRGPPT